MAPICNECDNLHRKEPPSSPRYNVWYNLLCKAKPRRATVDPVTGEQGYIGENDFGNEYVTPDPYQYCRDINNGICWHFQPTTPDVDLSDSVWKNLDL